MKTFYELSMKLKVLLATIAAMFLISVSSALATELWDLTGTYTIVFTCTSGCGGDYPHTMEVELMDLGTGAFSGDGHYNPIPGYTWDVTGSVSGSSVTAHILYTGIGAGYYVDLSGTIAADGTMSGTASSSSQKFTWRTTSGAADSDTDNDGVLNNVDRCPDTEAEEPDVSGTNRWKWDGDSWETVLPKGTGPAFLPTMDYTYGCSCEQILDEMKEATGFDFGGHYKYGCSKSILEDWNRGTYYIGPTFIETVEVPANDADGVSSVAILEAGKDYFLKAYGTATACWQTGCHIEFDAEYSTSDYGVNWVDGVAAPYNTYGTDLLDLKVDGAFVDWGTYNPEHTYQIPYAGTGNLLLSLVYDLAGSYFNDEGSLFVDIIEDKWVQLW